MYNFDKADLRTMEKELNRTPFNFNDYIPNSLKAIKKLPKRPDSKYSYSSANMSAEKSHLNASQERACSLRKAPWFASADVVGKDVVFNYNRQDVSSSHPSAPIGQELLSNQNSRVLLGGSVKNTILDVVQTPLPIDRIAMTDNSLSLSPPTPQIHYSMQDEADISHANLQHER